MSMIKDLNILWLFVTFFAAFLYLFYCFKQAIAEQREYFIKTLSHDLRVSVLAQLRGLDLLVNKTLPERDRDEILKEVRSGCIYTFDMITMLAKTYKYEKNEEILQKEIIDLDFILNNIFSEFNQKIEEKCIKLDCNMLMNTIEAESDAIQKALKIIFSVVFTNAYGDSKVTCFSYGKNNYSVLKITYNGLPLSEEDKNRMFSRHCGFSTVGHEIKMYLCKKIIEFHGGKMFVNVHNNITSFVLKLPISHTEKFYLQKCAVSGNV